MTAGNTEETVKTTPPVSITDTSAAEYSLDTEALKEKAMQVVSDVSERPLFYTQIFAYSAAAIIALTVLRAVISAVDSIPILPGVLELIGLSYTVWFFWRYVLFKESRQELLDEVEEFLGRARPQ
ncbi:Cyanobacterial aminoacyl-tRNA synthetase CAAD [Gracilaria domingensis]|nr:Cyanobacterial aminoacyl-tRNA synthetase CAAD [Gracilaria domingensis]